MSDLLRATLDDLAPEPPAHLLDVDGTRRRARSIRRRRAAAAVTGTLTAVALVLGLGAVVTRPPRPMDPARPPAQGAATYPDWPRRGDAPASVDRAAVAAWDATLRARDVRRRSEPRVLFAGGDPLVVVLHGLAEVGGERLVALTRRPGKAFTVYADVPAPPRGSRSLAAVLVEPDLRPTDSACDDPRRKSLSWLLVLAEPGARQARWRSQPRQGDACRTPGQTPEEAVDLAGGTLLKLVNVAWTAEVVVSVDGARTQVVGGSTGPYGSRIAHAPDEGAFSGLREDGSSASSLIFDVSRVPGWVGGEPAWSAALPDGTRASLSFATMTDGRRHALLLADDASGAVRLYLDVKRDPVPSAYAVIVDGYRGRWLLVVGHETLREAVLVDRGVRTPIPLDTGWGAILLDAEPSPDARVWTPDFAPGGGGGIASRTGTVLPAG